MKQYIKNHVYLCALLLLLCILPNLVSAQEGAGCDTDAVSCPIDGGLSILLAAGVAVGLKKIKEERKKKLNNLPNG